MTGGAPEVRSDISLTLLTYDIVIFTFYIQPMDQWSNESLDQLPIDHFTNRPMDQWTNGPRDQ